MRSLSHLGVLPWLALAVSLGACDGDPSSKVDAQQSPLQGWQLERVRFEVLGASRSGRLSVRAARGRLDAARRSLSLERFTLSHGALRLAGRRLEIDLLQGSLGSLDARDVRGVVRLGAGGPGADAQPSLADPGSRRAAPKAAAADPPR